MIIQAGDLAGGVGATGAGEVSGGEIETDARNRATVQGEHR